MFHTLRHVSVLCWLILGCYITYDVIWLLWVLVFLKLLIKSDNNQLIQKVEWTIDFLIWRLSISGLKQTGGRNVEFFRPNMFLKLLTFGVFDQIMQDFLFIAVLCFKWWFLACKFQKTLLPDQKWLLGYFSWHIWQFFVNSLYFSVISSGFFFHMWCASWILWCFCQFSNFLCFMVTDVGFT